jgi:hypothetical protein
MAADPWKRLLAGASAFRGAEKYFIEAYSEFVPPPRLGTKPFGTVALDPRIDGDPFGWAITEHEEAFELRPGLATLARRIVGALAHLGKGDPAHGVSRHKLDGNPYWPAALVNAAGKLAHERYVTLMPLALSRTQDDKGRLRWTLFGGSEQGPAAAFWRSFYHAPKVDHSAAAEGFFEQLLATVYNDPVHFGELHAAGFRVLPMGAGTGWEEGPLPRWTEPLVLKPRESLAHVKYLLTFRPFGKLPAGVQKAYLAGELHLLPFPGSLVFWGAPKYRHLRKQLPFAMQVPLLQMFPRHEDPHGIRVPQSGWLHEPRPGEEEPNHHHHGPFRNSYKRSHRWERVHRYDDELAVSEKEDRMAHVLFSTSGPDLGLYGKPMGRNVELWTEDYHLLLNGPHADAQEIADAADVLAEGGLFGYRLAFPAMRVGRHELYWHRPLAAYLSTETEHGTVLPMAPLGYLTAYNADEPNLDRPIELWPRLLDREGYGDAVSLFDAKHDHHPLQTANNVRKLFEAHHMLGGTLPVSLARRIISCPKHEPLDDWLDSLPGRSRDADQGRHLVEELRQRLGGAKGKSKRAARPLTYKHTATREFEEKFWQTIYHLSHGDFLTTNNADCVTDEPTQAALAHHHRDLDIVGDYLIRYHEERIAEAKMTGKALVGDVPFKWRTSYPFPWMGGWLKNQEGKAQERNIVVVIPGRDRRRAVCMCDHYDTAYMYDKYDPRYKGTGARIAAPGADDNHSATTTLMLAAPIFLEMSRKGQLGCDIWLVHLTGEEFPSDCLGARALAQRLVERSLVLRLPSGRKHNLSRVNVQGVYDLDMVAHNNPHDQDVFQISPGTGPQSLWLAYQAHLAAEAWNEGTREWNKSPQRRNCKRAKRVGIQPEPPATALHLELNGEVRLPIDPRSTLYNTDAQIFSDAGVPVVLFMENYDINREGYHDTHDTMENIDLDYGAAFSAIAIESVARAATEVMPAN